jgi:alpha-beta hydrolase superfamily lysophospholipase
MKSTRVFFFSTGFFVLVLIAAWSNTGEGRSSAETKHAPMTPQTSGISPSAENIIIDGQSENYSIRWYKPHTLQDTAGVALVIHGLNLKPDKMQNIISGLTDSGIEVLRVTLRGHGENFTHLDGIKEDKARLEAFKAVSFPLWINEAYLAYNEVQKRAEQKQVPLFFVGFSLGGLIGLDLLSSQDEVRYDRMVLFAPAIKLRAIHYMARILSPFSGLVVPSLAPDSYLSNKEGTPIAAYNALFEGLQQFEQHRNSKINVPALIFIDENDEFIPFQALNELIQEQKLDQWELYIVEKEAAASQDSFHHHIIDEYSTGKVVWKEMMKATITHLLPNRPN